MVHHEIYFKSSQAAENGDYEDLRPATGGRLTKVWDGYDDGELLKEIGVSTATIQKFYQARILQNSNRGTALRVDIHNDLLSTYPDYYEAVFCLSLWSDEAFRNYQDHFATWLADTELRADLVGGDDSTYDYYPDRWDVAVQLAQALGMEEVYRKHRANITTGNGRYADADQDLPDYIPEI